MTKKEIKQYLRGQIDSSVKEQSQYNEDVFCLCYNKSYARALKLSTITGQPVNKENFKGGDLVFWFNIVNKTFGYSFDIMYYLKINYSRFSPNHFYVISEVLTEYEEYKGYNVY